MANPLFSTYTQGENRVTSTLLAVLEHVNSRLAEDILEALIDESDLSLVDFENQRKGDQSIPDAAITGSTALWFEVKKRPGEVRRDQLEHHLSSLQDVMAESKRLIVLTPDEDTPEEVDSIDDPGLVWSNFDTLVGTIESILERDVGSAESSQYVPTEREAYLLRELVRFVYDEDDLVSGKEDRVLVVAARRAWDEYHEYGHYFCQPNRSFKPVSHLAFYKDKAIKPPVPTVLGSVESVTLTEEGVRNEPNLDAGEKEELLDVVERMEADEYERYGDTQKVLFLESDPEFELDQPIRNDKTANDSNRTVAFVFGHRYVSFSKLADSPEHTSELEE